MSKFIKDNEKVLEVFYKNNYGGFDDSNPYYYIVDKDFEIPEHRIIALSPKPTDLEFNLCWVLVNQEIVPTQEITEESFLLTNTETDSRLKAAKYPFYYARIDLSSYFEVLTKRKRKQDIEKQLNAAVKNFEKVAKFKAAAELEPELKPLVDEYIKLSFGENTTALNSGK